MASKITCDFCNEDLSETGMMPAYRLHLLAKEIPQPNGTYFVMKCPPIDGEMVFCSLEHMQGWLTSLAVGQKRADSAPEVSPSK